MKVTYPRVKVQSISNSSPIRRDNETKKRVILLLKTSRFIVQIWQVMDIHYII